MIPPTCVVFQLSFDAIFVLVASKISRVGLATASGIPKGINDGPMARMRIFLIEPAGPWTMNPSIRTSSPVPTGSRVEMLATRPGGALGVAVGVAVGDAVGVAVAVAVGEGVPVAVAVAVAVAVGVGEGDGDGKLQLAK